MSDRSFVVPTAHARALAAGALALSAAGIVFLRGAREGHSAGAPGAGMSSQIAHGAPRAEFRGPAAHGHLALSQGAITPDGAQHVLADLRIAADSLETAPVARPVAMAVVLDVSGSMAGEKLAQARASVLELVERMRDTDEIALVTYSDSARVVQPLAPLARVRDALRMTIPTLGIEGGTNIPTGLAIGAEALQSARTGLVRRIVLVSDGQDTSGRPLEGVRGEVRARAEQGITVSTLGIGTDYSESYMTALADAGRGNYEFVRNGAGLASFLSRELRQANSTTVERAVAQLDLPPGWRVERVIGSESQGQTGTVVLPIGALFAGDERRVVVDLVAPASTVGASHSIAIRAEWNAVTTGQLVRVGDGHLAVRVVGTTAEALASRDAAVYAEAQSAVLAVRQQEAVEAWRQGDRARAQAIASDNVSALRALSAAAPAAAPALARQSAAYASEAQAFGALSGASDEGRAFGLSANARHRAARMRAASY
jgi:Ca-activated chloride channel family protein